MTRVVFVQKCAEEEDCAFYSFGKSTASRSSWKNRCGIYTGKKRPGMEEKDGICEEWSPNSAAWWASSFDYYEKRSADFKARINQYCENHTGFNVVDRKTTKEDCEQKCRESPSCAFYSFGVDRQFAGRCAHYTGCDRWRDNSTNNWGRWFRYYEKI